MGSLWVVPGLSNYDWGIVTTLWQIKNWSCCFVIEPDDSQAPQAHNAIDISII